MKPIDQGTNYAEAAIVRGCKLAILAIAVTAFAAGCAAQPERGSARALSQEASSPWALPTSTMRWNEYACDLITYNRIGQVPAARTLAYLNLAINNAIVLARQQGRRTDGPAAGAAAAVLASFFPKDEQAIVARLNSEMAAIGGDGRADFTAGVEIGRTAAANVIAAAKVDRSALAWSGPAPSGPDKWVSLTKPPANPLGPRLGEMRPFFMKTGSDFRPAPPPAVDAAAFRNALAELRSISDKRTNEQLRVAQYWENLSGSFAAGLWNDVARSAISARGLSEAEAARILAMMHMVGVDAFIACHDAKYAYWVPRPTQVDPAIRLAIGVPNHPSYPSNHACVSGAMGLMLDSQLRDANGRYYAMGRQAGESRIYAGIHYRFDVDDGLVIAQKIVARANEVGLPAARPFVPMVH